MKFEESGKGVPILDVDSSRQVPKVPCPDFNALFATAFANPTLSRVSECADELWVALDYEEQPRRRYALACSFLAQEAHSRKREVGADADAAEARRAVKTIDGVAEAIRRLLLAAAGLKSGIDPKIVSFGEGEPDHEAWCDGSLRNAKAAVGILIKRDDEILHESVVVVDGNTASDVELAAFLETLRIAMRMDIRRLRIHVDSQAAHSLLLRQAERNPLERDILRLMENFQIVEVVKIHRSMNGDADRLAGDGTRT